LLSTGGGGVWQGIDRVWMGLLSYTKVQNNKLVVECVAECVVFISSIAELVI